MIFDTGQLSQAFLYYSCRLRGDCSHAGALLFVLCDIVSEGKTTFPPDPTCTELPCCWSNPEGKQNLAYMPPSFHMKVVYLPK